MQCGTWGASFPLHVPFWPIHDCAWIYLFLPPQEVASCFCHTKEWSNEYNEGTGGSEVIWASNCFLFHPLLPYIWPKQFHINERVKSLLCLHSQKWSKVTMYLNTWKKLRKAQLASSFHTFLSFQLLPVFPKQGYMTNSCRWPIAHIQE